MATMEGGPKELSMRLLSLTRRLGERLSSPASWIPCQWSPLTTHMSLPLEEVLPEEILFSVK